jgi:hypothetical protein
MRTVHGLWCASFRARVAFHRSQLALLAVCIYGVEPSSTSTPIVDLIGLLAESRAALTQKLEVRTNAQRKLQLSETAERDVKQRTDEQEHQIKTVKRSRERLFHELCDMVEREAPSIAGSTWGGSYQRAHAESSRQAVLRRKGPNA